MVVVGGGGVGWEKCINYHRIILGGRGVWSPRWLDAMFAGEGGCPLGYGGGGCASGCIPQESTPILPSKQATHLNIKHTLHINV